jgi:hypothetical protein
MRIVSYAGVRKSEVVQTAHEPAISLGLRGRGEVRRGASDEMVSVSWSIYQLVDGSWPRVLLLTTLA